MFGAVRAFVRPQGMCTASQEELRQDAVGGSALWTVVSQAGGFGDGLDAEPRSRDTRPGELTPEGLELCAAGIVLEGLWQSPAAPLLKYRSLILQRIKNET